jgi:hypothetical protein
MMSERTVEERPILNQLREEYFDHLSAVRRVAWQLETEIRYHTLPILHGLKSYEQLVIKSRVKGCESAIQALRRRQREGGTFDPEKQGSYSLLDLPDLAGARVLVFPRTKLIEVDDALRDLFTGWASDPIPVCRGAVLVPKYSGKCLNVNSRIQAEYQVVPMLIGLYWEVEHSAIYKLPPFSKGKAESAPMKDISADVEDALLKFEAEYEDFVMN